MNARNGVHDGTVLIVAQDFDRERILATVSYHSPNKLIIIANSADPDIIAPLMKDTIGRLKQDLGSKTDDGVALYPFLKEVVVRKVDWLDFSEAVARIDGMVADERARGNEVVVDVSGGIKPVAIAMYLAANLNKVKVSYATESMWGDPSTLRPLIRRIKDEMKERRFRFSVDTVTPLPLLPLSLNLDKFTVDMLEQLNRRGGFARTITDLVGRKKSAIMKGHRRLASLYELGYVDRRSGGYQISSMGRALLPMKRCSFLRQDGGET
jgi:hypothetical protein